MATIIQFPHTFLPTGFSDGAYQHMYCCHCGARYTTGQELAPVEPCPAFQMFEIRIKPSTLSKKPSKE